MCLFLVVLGLSHSMQDFLLWCLGFSLVEARRLRSCIQQASLPCSTWNPVSPTRDRTWAPCIERQILNNWTTREVLEPKFEWSVHYGTYYGNMRRERGTKKRYRSVITGCESWTMPSSLISQKDKEKLSQVSIKIQVQMYRWGIY